MYFRFLLASMQAIANGMAVAMRMITYTLYEYVVSIRKYSIGMASWLRTQAALKTIYLEFGCEL